MFYCLFYMSHKKYNKLLRVHLYLRSTLKSMKKNQREFIFLDGETGSLTHPTPNMTPEQLHNLLPYKKSEDPVHFYLPDNFVPGSIAFANFPVKPNIRKPQTNRPYKRPHQSSWTQSEAKRIYVKKTVNLYHWTQPGLPADFVRKIVSDSWDNMSEEEKQVYEKQANGEYGPLMIHPHLSLMYQCGQLGKFNDQSNSS